ncbi:MAG: branched-chain amino acid aminotransferase [Flavobacterium sp.]|jgi:branched-chain amino acid aminotransferase
MVNFNGQINNSEFLLSNNNRSFLYGDGIFETLKVVNRKIIFWEDHYFRLMASMRIVRMKIPKNFTLEFLENEILNLVDIQNLNNLARVRITVFRNDGGLYLPKDLNVSYLIQTSELKASNYQNEVIDYEVDLYKDFFVAKNLLSTLKTTSKMIHVTGSVFAKENDFDNCILLNSDKNVIEFLNGNLFLVKDQKLITPPISEGCLNGIIRKKILEIKSSELDIEIKEEIISPFELQKADELFVTNTITGIQSVSLYRKKNFENKVANELVAILNQKAQSII